MSEVDGTRYECSMCGREGGPIQGCSSCGGSERFKVVAVGATLSDLRAGRVKPVQRELGPATKDSTWQGTE